MKNNRIRFLLAIVVLLLPVIGYCNPFSDWFKNPQEVATEIATLDDDNEIRGLDFSPDGKYLAADTYFPGTIQIWDWQNKRIVRTLEKAHGANIGQVTESIRYSLDGRLLAACHSLAKGDVTVRIWNTENWTIVKDITDPQGGMGCNAIGFTPDGKSLIRVLNRMPQFSGDTFIIYATDTWLPVWGLRTVPFYPRSMTISPDGKFVAIGGEIRNPAVWSFDSPRPSFGTPPLPDQALVIIVDMAQRAIVHTIPAFPAGNDLTRLAWGTDGVHIVAGASGVPVDGADAIRIFDAKTGTLVNNEPSLTGTHVRALRYTPDGKYLIESGLGKRIKIWDGQHRELLQEIHGDAASSAVSRDGRYLAMGGVEAGLISSSAWLSLILSPKGKILIWELKNKTPN